MMQLSRNGRNQIVLPHSQPHVTACRLGQHAINYNEPEKAYNYDIIIIVTTNVRKVFDLPPDPQIPLISTWSLEKS